jgi:hypothetical protein
MELMTEIEVESQHESNSIKAIGFDITEQDLEMIKWLRKGGDVVRFVIDDVETELYAQDSDSQLLSVHCLRRPEFQTKALKKHPSDSQVIVTQFKASFPLHVEVRSSGGAIWKLEVEHSYHASNMETPSDFALRLDFTIVGQQQASR